MVSSSKHACLLILLFCAGITGISQTRTLDFYLDEGLRNSPVLNDLNNRLKEGSVDSLIIEAQRKPFIEGVSQLIYYPYNGRLGYDEVITDGGNYQVVASVSQEIFNRRRTVNRFRSLDIRKESTVMSGKLSEAELKKTITNLYLEAYSAWNDLDFNRSFLELLTSELSLLKDFADRGVCSQTDYLSMLVEAGGQEVTITRMKNIYDKDLMLLNEICGIVDTAKVVLKEPDIQLTEIDGTPDFIFLRQFITDSLDIVNSKEAVGLGYRPVVKWFADAGILTSSPWNFYRHFGVGAGLSLNVPVYDGHQKRLEEQKLAIKENTRSFNSLSARKQYDQNYLRLKEELKDLDNTGEKLEEQLVLADRLVKTLKAQLESGIVKMTEYINAIRNYRTINMNRSLIKIETAVVKNEMNYLLTQ